MIDCFKAFPLIDWLSSREVHHRMEEVGLTLGPYDFTPHATLAKTSMAQGKGRRHRRQVKEGLYLLLRGGMNEYLRSHLYLICWCHGMAWGGVVQLRILKSYYQHLVDRPLGDQVFKVSRVGPSGVHVLRKVF